ncbi:MAG: hypothetical protein HOO06_12580 [Bdellovibrionaceae bacterium]|jgi:two-component system, NtrC family, C4-dicarboxylate transport sensor histidine kinase DctB|nr:hypothetical protein [Pseudobdellovibrionaceae bacterium]
MIISYLIGLGILTLCFSFYINIKIFKKITTTKFKKRYLLNLFLIVFFVIFYIFFELLFFQKAQTEQQLLVATILFMGSIFVLIMTKTAGRLIDELNDLNNNLEKKVMEKNSELISAQNVLQEKVVELENTQEQLSQASKMSALGEVAGQIAHEFNSPLGAITLTTQSLKKLNNGISEEKIKINMENNLNHILKITGQISKIISSLQRVFGNENTKNTESVLAMDLIEDVIWLFSEKVRRVGVDFTVVNKFKDGVRITCRVSDITQALIHLLNNAYDEVKDRSERAISLHTSQIHEVIEFRVSDNGSGIDNEIKEKIFKSQFTTKKSGLGIGLGISLKIAHDHQGDLYLDDNFKETTFVLKLPLAPSHL